MCLPREPLGVEDIAAVTEGLLRAGAMIGELNTVRKHCEVLKGGVVEVRFGLLGGNAMRLAANALRTAAIMQEKEKGTGHPSATRPTPQRKSEPDAQARSPLHYRGHRGGTIST